MRETAICRLILLSVGCLISLSSWKLSFSPDRLGLNFDKLEVATTVDTLEHTAPFQSLTLESTLFPEPPPLDRFPPWFQEYAKWHSNELDKLERDGTKHLLLQANHGPQLLIKICPYECGGLHDRTMCMGEFLYQGYLRKRLVLVKWYHPKFTMESFLLPRNIINFTVPDMENVTDTPEQLQNYASTQGDRIVISTTREGCFPIPDDRRLHFRSLWNFLFDPSPQLRRLILETFHRLQITPRQYNALHLRVRHPAQYGRKKGIFLDFDGFPWNETSLRDRAIQTGLRALQCTNSSWNIGNSGLPIFIYSDTAELVQYLTEESRDDVVLSQTLLGRKSTENAHMTSQTGSSWLAYASGFIDLWVASYSRKLGVGVGNFAVLAYKLGEQDFVLFHTRKRTDRLGKRWGYGQIDGGNRTTIESCV